MNITPTPEQKAILDKILHWYFKTDEKTLTVGGYAGTGKTTILSILFAELRNRTQLQFVSFTGKAVHVLKNKLPPAASLSTIHSLIYTPVFDSNNKIIGWEKKKMVQADEDVYDYSSQIPFLDLIINDEASMTGEELYNDLTSYPSRFLFLGDHGQLPPVKSSFNLMEKPQLRLETVLRQALESPIIALATKARKTGWLEEKEYSEHVVVCRKQTAPLRVKQLFLAPSPDTLRIVATNKARIENNIFLVKEHRRRLSLPTEDTRTPFPGAQIICLQNSRRSALFNGMTGTISGPPIDCLNHWEAPATFDDQPYTILADKGYFNNPTPERTSRNPAVLPFDFSYTLTCHKAQGSEAPRVFVLGNGFGTAEERRRWLYTAITRARDELYVIR